MLYFISEDSNSGSETLHVVTTDIHDEMSLERIRIATGRRIVPEERSEAEVRQLIRAHAVKDSDSLWETLDNEGKPACKANTWESEPIINLVDSLMETALSKGVSDIHLEPCDEGLRIRFREDGMLENYRTLPSWFTDPVLVRLKILASVDITERRLPHDGSFRFSGIHSETSVRLSTIPTQGGEKCVLRLLPAQDCGQTLEKLQLTKATLAALRDIFTKPQGLFLMTGPTGSGKTTTLYAGIREIISRDINVTTIEDPVEYPLDGANQVQVNERCGFTFATALRSILRQDPDVILVGEIRDEETARIAVRAAQTGHLVLSTLHTNSAKAAYERMRDLGICESALEDSVIGIAAQRLLRQVAEDGTYKGRVAALELLLPGGSYADGTIREYAERLVKQKITDSAEVRRVLG